VGGPLECRSSPDRLGDDNPRIAAGWPFFGQFIAHDITHDRSPLRETQDTETLQNSRKPRLDLECLYGAGQVSQPYLFDVRDGDKLLIGHSGNRTGDVPRNDQGLALIGDPRNDTHLFISQLHLAFLYFHNRVVDRVRDAGVKPDQVFDQAARTVRRHYQWIVLPEFLPLSVGHDLMEELKSAPKLCRFGGKPFIPVEFSGGAHRFGHAQIRERYDVNSRLLGVPIFPSLVGICPVTPDRQVDWKLLFEFDGAGLPQASRRIKPQLVPGLMRLPEALVGRTPRPEFSSLAARDLCRGHSIALPSGEAIARTLGVSPCTSTELHTAETTWRETPLWLYVLAEAEAQHNGEYLGEVGGRIVGEVLLELLRQDPSSIMSDPDWRPELADANGDFGIAHLLKCARVV
jgi:hypothetical protein